MSVFHLTIRLESRLAKLKTFQHLVEEPEVCPSLYCRILVSKETLSTCASEYYKYEQEYTPPPPPRVCNS